MNWREMEFNWIRAIILVILIGSDTAVSVYQRYFVDRVDRVFRNKKDRGDVKLKLFIVVYLLDIGSVKGSFLVMGLGGCPGMSLHIYEQVRQESKVKAQQ
ncbi:unnamed protein product [Haemonchus placei]|uniref:PH domain-containing protein n=1 Tax=Haemonchus placei TaxID=6290 RepID=A0A0N4WY16_HAEPC|nr:unnamed protein product [Haemonchus placei]